MFSEDVRSCAMLNLMTYKGTMCDERHNVIGVHHEELDDISTL